MMGGTVYGTFGSHCDLLHYTGMVAGIGTVAGVGANGILLWKLLQVHPCHTRHHEPIRRES